MKSFGMAATLVATAAAWMEWDLSSIDVPEAIPKSHFSRYSLSVKYGPFTAIDGSGYAYMYIEVGGDKIKDGSIVSTFAMLHPTDEVAFETPECRVRY